MERIDFDKMKENFSKFIDDDKQVEKISKDISQPEKPVFIDENGVSKDLTK